MVCAHSQTTNRLLNEATNDSTQGSMQDLKKPPTLGTNQITRSLTKKKVKDFINV